MEINIMNWSSDWGKPVQPIFHLNKTEDQQPIIVGIDVSWGEDKTYIHVIQDNKVIAAYNITEQEITITREGEWPKKVEATIIGTLGIHKDIGADEGSWRITHVPTTAKFDRALPSNIQYSKDELMIWCAKVQSRLFDDWKLLNALTPTNYETDEGTPEDVAKDNILEWCKSVKV